MAQAVNLTNAQFLVLLGNGATPEVFTAPCAFISKSLALSKDMVDTVNPDCDSPDAAVWVDRQPSTLSAQIQGSGRLAAADLDDWRAFFTADAGKNCRVQYNVSGANNGGYFSGLFHLTSLTWSVERSGKVDIEVTMSSSGALTWTAAA
jgi:predicted secreted protein